MKSLKIFFIKIKRVLIAMLTKIFVRAMNIYIKGKTK